MLESSSHSGLPGKKRKEFSTEGVPLSETTHPYNPSSPSAFASASCYLLRYIKCLFMLLTEATFSHQLPFLKLASKASVTKALQEGTCVQQKQWSHFAVFCCHLWFFVSVFSFLCRRVTHRPECSLKIHYSTLTIIGFIIRL